MYLGLDLPHAAFGKFQWFRAAKWKSLSLKEN